MPARSLPRRWVLWGALVALVVSMLSTLVWLAGRYEMGQLQARIERDAADAVNDIRTGLTRNVQSLQALQFVDRGTTAWIKDAALLLRDVVGMPYAEIAETLEISLANVKWRIYRAREDVAQALGREGVGPETRLASTAM